MNKKKIAIPLIICMIVAYFYIYQRLDNTHSSELLSHIQEVYTPTYQNQIKDNINVMKNKNYTLDDPLILEILSKQIQPVYMFIFIQKNQPLFPIKFM